MACGTGGSCGTGGGGSGCQSTGTSLAWQRLGLDEILDALYPTRTWGELDYEAARRMAPPASWRRSLAAELAATLSRPVLFCAGGDDEMCDYLYVRIKPRAEGALLELREGLRTTLPAGELAEEVHLRVALSTIAPLAHVRQVRLRGSLESGLLLVEETVPTRVTEPGAKFYERRLTAPGGALLGAGLTHLDVRLLDGPLEGFAPGEHAALIGGEPTLTSFLFSSRPTDIATTSMVALDAGAALQSSASASAA